MLSDSCRNSKARCSCTSAPLARLGEIYHGWNLKQTFRHFSGVLRMLVDIGHAASSGGAPKHSSWLAPGKLISSHCANASVSIGQADTSNNDELIDQIQRHIFHVFLSRLHRFSLNVIIMEEKAFINGSLSPSIYPKFLYTLIPWTALFTFISL